MRKIPIVGVVFLLASCAQLRIWTGPEIPDDLAVDRLPRVEPRATDHRKSDALRFLVFGDAGTGEREQREIAAAMLDVCEARGGCSFALVTGDLIYPVGIRPTEDPAELAAQFETPFERPYGPFGRFDFWVVAGNHDWNRRGSTSAQVAYSAYSDRWRMPSLDYRVPLLPDWIAVYALDTTLIGKDHPIGQLERAERELCDADGWKILFGHHPVYGVGPHAGRTGSIPEIRDALLGPLISKCGIDLFFAGHEHLQAHIAAPQFDQIIQGAGGRRLHTVREGRRLPEDVEVREARSRFGFALVEATPSRLEVAFFAIDDDDVHRFYTAGWRR